MASPHPNHRAGSRNALRSPSPPSHSSTTQPPPAPPTSPSPIYQTANSTSYSYPASNPNQTTTSPPLSPISPLPALSLSPSPPQSRSQTPTNLQTLLSTAVDISNPALRHLASQSTLGSLHSRSSDPRSFRTRASGRSSTFRPLSATFEEQRVLPKRGFRITRNTRAYEPPFGSVGVYGAGDAGGKVDVDGKVDGDGNGIAIGEGKGDRKRASGISGISDRGLNSADGNHGSLTGGWSARGHLRGPSRAESGFSTGNFSEAPLVSGKDEEELTELSKDHIGNVDSREADTGTDEISDKAKENEDGNVYPSSFGLTILVVGLCLSVFLISLDRTIITTAIPFITSEFHSTDDIGWYGSAYLLTASAFQPLYGRIFMLFNMKWSYLTSLGLFELGSLICAISPNSMALIIGRAIQGLGSAGILTGSFVVVSHAVPLHKRPIFTAVVGLMFGVGATVGPLLGGVFTDLVTWRWCFYFNLPVGGATVVAMVLFFHPPKKHAMMDKSFFYRIMELDLVGNVFLLAAAIMLFLALQYTEQQVAWSSAKVIGLLVGAGLMFIVFCIWQWWKADGALMPPRILKQRSVAASCAAAFFIYSAILIHTYYLPIWFQAIKGDSAVHSGVNMIPYVVANALFSLLAGIFVSKNGYFTAPAIVGCAIGTIGAGLLSTIGPNTSSSMWIGYEIVASVGIGMAIQQGFTAIQIVLPLDEVAIGTAAVVAFQSLGGAIFVSVGNTILQNTLLSAADNNALPGIDIQAVIDAGASEFRNMVTTDQLPALLQVYNRALQKVFIAAIPMIGLAFISCLCLEWRSVKDKKRADDEEAYKKLQARKEKERMVVEAHKGLHIKEAGSRTTTGMSGHSWWKRESVHE